MNNLDYLRIFHGPRYEIATGKSFQTYYNDTASRCDIVKRSTDIAALKDAVDRVSVTVRKAIQIRIRQLEKAS